MSRENINLMRDMAARYPKLKLTGSKLAGDFYVSEQYSIKVDSDQDPEDWKVFHSKTGGFLHICDISGADKLVISEFMMTYTEFKAGKVKTAQPTPGKKQPEPKADPKKKSPKQAKHNSKVKTEESPDHFGIELPIAYPPEMKGQFIKFRQWKKVNNVITSESEVLVLGEDEYNYTVNIPSAHMGFTIGRDKVEIINPV